MIEVLDTVTSTMDVARENVVSGRLRVDSGGRIEPAGVMAREQTAGRGQRGRDWYAPREQGLCATYYYPCHSRDLSGAGHISLLAGVAVAEEIRRRLAAAALSGQVGLKWPNDVVLNGKKVGGILIELVQSADSRWIALIGVGVNVTVSQVPSELESWVTSLLREGVAPCDWQDLGQRIADSLMREAERYRAGGFAAILDRWRAYDQTPGRAYETELGGSVVVGVAEGVDDAGALLLRLGDRRILPVSSASRLRETMKDEG